MSCASRGRGLLRVSHGAFVAALTVAGCVAAPDVREASLPSPDAALRSFAAIVANEPALIEEPAPSEWWQLFGDATLTALQTEAAGSNLWIFRRPSHASRKAARNWAWSMPRGGRNFPPGLATPAPP